jgi:hypothetical protein
MIGTRPRLRKDNPRSYSHLTTMRGMKSRKTRRNQRSYTPLHRVSGTSLLTIWMWLIWMRLHSLQLWSWVPTCQCQPQLRGRLCGWLAQMNPIFNGQNLPRQLRHPSMNRIENGPFYWRSSKTNHGNGSVNPMPTTAKCLNDCLIQNLRLP